MFKPVASQPRTLYPEPKAAEAQPGDFPRLKLIFFGVAGLLFIVISVCSLSLVAVARTQPAPAIAAPPPELLPGRNLPASAHCTPIHDGHFRCIIQVRGENIELLYDGASQAIQYIFESGKDVTLGDMVNAWGMPSGYRRFEHVMAVYWNSRTAFLRPCSFEYTSPVAYISYGKAQETPLLWRGLVSQADTCAPAMQQ